MKPNRWSVVLLGALLLTGDPGVCSANWLVVFEEDFDDGDFSGWVVRNAYDPSTTEGAARPDVIALPAEEGAGYAIFGVGSGYGEPYPHGRDIGHDLPLAGVGALRVEFRAKSGLATPNHVSVALVSGGDHYLMRVYGEGNMTADFRADVGGVETWGIRYGLGGAVADWHVYEWTRDSDGWWSLNVDGGAVEAPNFYHDDRLTAFNQIGIEPFRDQSGLDWIRVSVPEPTTLALVALGGVMVVRRRKKWRDA